MDLGEKIATDIAVTTAINLAQKVRGLVFIPLITKFLGTTAYGVFIQVTVVATVMATIFRIGLESALVRYMQGFEEQDERAQLYYSILTVGTISGATAAGVIAIAAEPVSQLTLSSERYAPIFTIGAALIPLYIIQEIEKNFFRSEMRVKTYSLLDGVKVYLEVGTLIVIIWWFGYGLSSVFYTLIGVHCLFIIATQAIITRQIGIKRPSTSGFYRYFRYSIPVMIAGISGMSQDRADRILIGYFIGPAAVGIYSIAYTLARLIRIFALPLRISFFAEFSRLWEDGCRSDAYQILTNGIRYFVTLSIPSIIGLYLIAPSLLPRLSTAEVAQQATNLILVLTVAITCIGFATIYQQVFYAAERTRIISIIRGVAGLLNVGLNIVLIPRFGILGAAMTTLATFGLTCFLIFGLSHRYFSTPIPVMFVVKSVIAAVAMTIAITVLKLTHFVTIILVAPPVYFTVLYSIGGLSKSDISFLWSTARSIKP